MVDFPRYGNSSGRKRKYGEAPASEWPTEQMPITHRGNWVNPRLLPEIPIVQGHPVQPSTLPFHQQYTLPSVDVVPERSGPPLFNYSNMMYSMTSLDQQYGAQNLPGSQQSLSYGVAPVQGNSSYLPEQGGILSAESFLVPHIIIDPLVHNLTSCVDPDVYLISLKVYLINRRKHRPLSGYTEPTRT